jgi:hypothetical protein
MRARQRNLCQSTRSRCTDGGMSIDQIVQFVPESGTTPLQTPTSATALRSGIAIEHQEESLSEGRRVVEVTGGGNRLGGSRHG